MDRFTEPVVLGAPFARAPTQLAERTRDAVVAAAQMEAGRRHRAPAQRLTSEDPEVVANETRIIAKKAARFRVGPHVVDLVAEASCNLPVPLEDVQRVPAVQFLVSRGVIQVSAVEDCVSRDCIYRYVAASALCSTCFDNVAAVRTDSMHLAFTELLVVDDDHPRREERLRVLPNEREEADTFEPGRPDMYKRY